MRPSYLLHQLLGCCDFADMLDKKGHPPLGLVTRKTLGYSIFGVACHQMDEADSLCHTRLVWLDKSPWV